MPSWLARLNRQFRRFVEPVWGDIYARRPRFAPGDGVQKVGIDVPADGVTRTYELSGK